MRQGRNEGTKKREERTHVQRDEGYCGRQRGTSRRIREGYEGIKREKEKKRMIAITYL